MTSATVFTPFLDPEKFLPTTNAGDSKTNIKAQHNELFRKNWGPPTVVFSGV